MARIALVEDHLRLAGLIERALDHAGIATDRFTSIDGAWIALRPGQYGALILDRGLPDGDGIRLLRRLREARIAVPCMMLTARDALHDRIDGLEAGADDYLVKPFSMAELVARTRSLLRRPTAWHPQALAFGDIVLDPAAGTLRVDGRQVVLAAAELRMLVVLVQAAGAPVGRRLLEDAGWGLREAVTPNAFDVALHRLRRKLREAGATVGIRNLRAHGYALDASPPVDAAPPVR
jgi:DNA-binding response OmpR family regulator